MYMTHVPRLNVGDTVALLTMSWGGPHAFPHVYTLGKKRLEEQFGLVVKEYPSTLASAEELFASPEMRAKDVTNAFHDPTVQGIISTIGGEESLRILPFLDLPELAKHPKVFLGYSDTTTLLTALNMQGLPTFHGPSVMAGFAEPSRLPDAFVDHVKRFFFTPWQEFTYEAYPSWTEELLPWEDPQNLLKQRAFTHNDGWHVVQGGGRAQGVLFGGNIEVLEFLKGTPYFPGPDFWQGKLLFLETSEEVPSVEQVIRWLRNYALLGVFDAVPAVLFGRLRGYSSKEKVAFDKRIHDYFTREVGRPELLIITNLDFGHTDPQWILPLGVHAQVDLENKKLMLLETPFI